MPDSLTISILSLVVASLSLAGSGLLAWLRAPGRQASYSTSGAGSSIPPTSARAPLGIGAVGVAVNTGDHRAVELEVIGMNGRHLAQAGIARAHVVDREHHSAFAQLSDRSREVGVFGLDQRVLGHLDHEAREPADGRRRLRTALDTA